MSDEAKQSKVDFSNFVLASGFKNRCVSKISPHAFAEIIGSVCVVDVAGLATLFSIMVSVSLMSGS